MQSLLDTLWLLRGDAAVDGGGGEGAANGGGGIGGACDAFGGLLVVALLCFCGGGIGGGRSGVSIGGGIGGIGGIGGGIVMFLTLQILKLKLIFSTENTFYTTKGLV